MSGPRQFRAMACPGCGCESIDLREACRHCGAPMPGGAAAPGAPPVAPEEDLLGLRFEPGRSAPARHVSGPGRQQTARQARLDRGGDFVEMLDDDAIEVGEDDLDGVFAAGRDSVEDPGGPPFRIDDDLFSGYVPGAPAVSGTASAAWAEHDGLREAADADLPGPSFVYPDEEHGIPGCVEPIIDRDDEVPERYWAPEVAGLGRRALALLVDQSLLLAVLGIFFLGAFVALRLSGFETDFFLSAAGLQASALPFALLAALLSFAYHVFFHGSTGRTPGKALAGIEVRAGNGAELTWGRALLRWFCAALGLACAGAGVAWALFEPRRCGWADLLSGTVIARRRREPAGAPPRR